jgi:23S rRNA (cytidine1920-2'-O)/16S rRNA (cytidine1409-2'-O)-methyltransferase
MPKERLDILVQQRTGLTRSQAQGLILTGNVLGADGQKIDKPGLRVADDIALTIRESARFVSRGGDKLEAAFDAFPLDVTGVVAMDVGASTGGFTDCLLQHGAARVYAVDVGYGQLAWKLRQDPRVIVMERCNARNLTAADLPERPTFFVADCSFISLYKILPPVLAILGPDPSGVALIKPQFEAGPEQVGKGGVVRDPKVHEQVVAEVCAMAQRLGFGATDVIPSPLLGPAGNREFLVWLHAFSPPEQG